MALEALVNGEHRRACQQPRRRGKPAAAGQRLDDAAEREDDDRWGQYPIAGVLWTKASSVSCLTRKSATSAREMYGRRPGLRSTLAL
jgi:hypothetical protein